MPEINGVQPNLANKLVQALLVQQFWHEGKLEDPANVVHICVASQWHRLYFDYGVVFWRLSDSAPSLDSNDMDDGFGYPLVDFGAQHYLIGRRIISLNTFDDADCDAAVSLNFDSGVTVLCRSDDDVTTIEASTVVPRGT